MASSSENEEEIINLKDAFNLSIINRENTLLINNGNDDECFPHGILMDRKSIDLFNMDLTKYQKSEYRRIFNLNSRQLTDEPKFTSEPSANEKSLDSEDLDKKKKKEDSTLKPRIHTFLSFFVPFIGLLKGEKRIKYIEMHMYRCHYLIRICGSTCNVPRWAGCLSYLFSLKYDESSPRRKYANRALCVGSALSVIYSFAICSLLGHYVYQYNSEDLYGYTY
ncbi:Uncharacterized protein PCOAH_00038760 [Plasmodium coatneyi]|uniref:Uncharacterized protein n=1 Tax=Plasmodium coatneyi TaxID=208452 RepID=A0A1B1E5E4_9APIC|nr:Uncharacterized protein PCOAH_00038760 [Plasmodium coatneyi]ANQ10252.1 Uncharacterized protein PCOAH_00038760 [Plasmodium coatneyi]